MKYYVVGKGRVLSAIYYERKWTAFRTNNRNYATGLSKKHANAWAYKMPGTKVINETEFKKYHLNDEPTPHFQ